MIIDNSGTGIATLGRDEDRYVAHVAQGERVVPPVISADTQARLSREMVAAGLDPNEYIVGPSMSINPITGQPEFGWLKKTFKSVKKVVKKAAPVLGVASMFVPGLGTAMGGVLGKLGSGVGSLLGKVPGIGGALQSGAGMIGKGITSLSSGIGNLVSKVPGMGQLGTNLQNFGTAAQTFADPNFGLTFGDAFGALKTGVGSLLSPKQIGGNLVQTVLGGGQPMGGQMGYPGVAGGMIYPSQQGGINQAQQFLNQFKPNSYTEINGVGYVQGVDGQLYPANQVQQMYNQYSQPQGGMMFTGGSQGQSRLGLIEDFLKGRESDPVRQGGGSGISGVFGSLFGKQPGQSYLGTIEDFFKGRESDFSKPGSGRIGLTSGIGSIRQGIGDLTDTLFGLDENKRPLIDPAIAGLAVGYGKLIKEAAERQSGGMEDIRQTLRPDLAQPVTYGGGMGFDVGLPRYAEGGQVLDMRDGGESEGPGTGTSDDIPAMLSDGEFVMTAKAVRGAGAFDVQQSDNGIMLVAKEKASREKGSDNMMKLMRTFENYG